MSANDTRQARGNGIFAQNPYRPYDVPFGFLVLSIGCGCIQYLRARAKPLTAVMLMHDPWKYAVCASFILSSLENTRLDNPISIEIAKM